MTWKEWLHPRDPDGEFAHESGWLHRTAGVFGGGGGHQRVQGRDLRGGVDYERLWAAHPQDPTTFQGEDHTLKPILNTQGFDGPPRVATRHEMDQAVAAGWTPLWRGVGVTREAGDGYAEQFRTGDLWAGLGAYGNGTYAMPDWRRTDANGYGSTVMRMALHPDARVVSRAELHKLMDEDGIGNATRVYKGTEAGRDSPRERVMADEGRYAALHGYDAIMVSYTGDKAPSPGERNEPGSVMEWVVLNRTALMVQEDDGTNPYGLPVH